MADIILKLSESQVDINYILFLLRMMVHITSLTPTIYLKFRYQVRICHVSIQTLFLLFICYDSELFRGCFVFVYLFVVLGFLGVYFCLFPLSFPFLFFCGMFSFVCFIVWFGFVFFILFCLSLFYFFIFYIQFYYYLLLLLMLFF